MANAKIIEQKATVVSEIKEKLENAKSVVMFDYRGLSVEKITALRDKLREKNAVLKVVKNNFARIAFEDMKVENVAEYLKGPTVIAMAKEDSNEVAKVLFDFSKDAPTLVVKGASIANEIYDQAKTEAYSKVPGKKQLYAMRMSAMNGPVQKLAATLQAYADKKSEEGAN